jgi:hypothetical protein
MAFGDPRDIKISGLDTTKNTQESDSNRSQAVGDAERMAEQRAIACKIEYSKRGCTEWMAKQRAMRARSYMAKEKITE